MLLASIIGTEGILTDSVACALGYIGCTMHVEPASCCNEWWSDRGEVNNISTYRLHCIHTVELLCLLLLFPTTHLGLTYMVCNVSFAQVRVVNYLGNLMNKSIGTVHVHVYCLAQMYEISGCCAGDSPYQENIMSLLAPQKLRDGCTLREK